jgi:broad specificity phosphatase PhoE
MKWCFLSVFLLVLIACSSPKIFIVRHAEKSVDPPENPHLTVVGQQRAKDLGSLLKGKKIKRIYSTETNRTKETALPLSEVSGKPIQVYKNDTLKAMLLRIIESGENTLIVGHSNTILPMLDALQIKHSIKEIPDNDYDNLFIVGVKKKSLAGYTFKLKETTYGELSPATGDTAKPVMK